MNDCCILVVDDDRDIREALKDVLEDEGHYSVCEARNGAEALELIRGGKSKPGVILLDLMMPVMDGYELAAVLHADPDTSQIPVVVISASGTSAQMQKLGPVAFLPKPIRVEALLSAVGTYC